jgi:hypothetical protein
MICGFTLAPVKSGSVKMRDETIVGTSCVTLWQSGHDVGLSIVTSCQFVLILQQVDWLNPTLQYLGL